MAMITYRALKRAGACSTQLEEFRKRFGTSVDVTEEACVAVADVFAWDWAAHNLFLASAREAYYKATASALKNFDEATAPAWKTYNEATASALKTYNEATALAWKACNEATASARKTYNEARASALKTYIEATAPAHKVYNEATASTFARIYNSQHSLPLK